MLNRPTFPIPTLFLLLLLAGQFLMSGCEPSQTATNDECNVAGVSYQTGDIFTAEDGCNVCTCLEDGIPACTLLECETVCQTDNETYEVGQAFLHEDGCNQCLCLVTGQIACTEKACGITCEYGGDIHQVGDVFLSEDECNQCVCTDDGSVGCDDAICPDLCGDFVGPCVSDDSCPGELICSFEGCNPSICSCDALTGMIGCTADCGGGVCVEKNKDLCEDFIPPCQDDEGCPGELICTFEGCNPSECQCEPETGMTLCTDDCGGGVCVEKNEDLCEDFIPPCEDDEECPGELICSFEGCNPSHCFCHPDTGDALCTSDCSGGECVEDSDACTPGETFPADDECNTCGCPANGKKSEALCTLMDCTPECKYGMVWTECASSCPPTCDNTLNSICAGICLDQCACPPDKPIFNGLKCIDFEECPPTCVDDDPLDGQCCGDKLCNGDEDIWGCPEDCFLTDEACDYDFDPNKWYVASSPEACMVVDFACPDNSTYFDNECGCGCELIICETDSDANKWYAGSSPEECMVIDYACPENTEYFDNECGCGCIQNASCPASIPCAWNSCEDTALVEKCPLTMLLF